ncbi:MAG: type IV secretion system protein [Treponema sp.]|nr:type IV secretion system protein [Treponema sp.]
MAATHKSTVYKPENVENPFREGQDKAYADILFDKMTEVKWWRNIVGVGVLAALFINFILFFSIANRQQTIPVLVNVMPTGEAQYLGQVRQGQLQVPETAIVFQIRTFVTNLRSISIDPQVLYNNITLLYAMVTTNYEPIMTRMLRANSPFDQVGRIRRSAEIESIIRITQDTYQVDWIDVVFDGMSQRNTRMRALVTVRLLPVTGQSARDNPLGIYIDGFEMTEL